MTIVVHSRRIAEAIIKQLFRGNNFGLGVHSITCVHESTKRNNGSFDKNVPMIKSCRQAEITESHSSRILYFTAVKYETRFTVKFDLV